MQLLHVGSNVLKLWRNGGVIVWVWLAFARPSKTLPASKPEKTNYIWDGHFLNFMKEYYSPLSLAVKSAGWLGSAESKLGGAEVAAALAILLPALLVHARPVLLPDGVAGGGAEGGAQVASRGEERSQVGQADWLLTALAFTCNQLFQVFTRPNTSVAILSDMEFWWMWQFSASELLWSCTVHKEKKISKKNLAFLNIFTFQLFQLSISLWKWNLSVAIMSLTSQLVNLQSSFEVWESFRILC